MAPAPTSSSSTSKYGAFFNYMGLGTGGAARPMGQQPSYMLGLQQQALDQRDPHSGHPERLAPSPDTREPPGLGPAVAAATARTPSPTRQPAGGAEPEPVLQSFSLPDIAVSPSPWTGDADGDRGRRGSRVSPSRSDSRASRAQSRSSGRSIDSASPSPALVAQASPYMQFASNQAQQPPQRRYIDSRDTSTSFNDTGSQFWSDDRSRKQHRRINCSVDQAVTLIRNKINERADGHAGWIRRQFCQFDGK